MDLTTKEVISSNTINEPIEATTETKKQQTVKKKKNVAKGKKSKSIKSKSKLRVELKKKKIKNVKKVKNIKKVKLSINNAVSKAAVSKAAISKADNDSTRDYTNFEDSALEVAERFERGCECEEICFKNLDPEVVYKHRLNIAELTKEEHDMYLMGLIRSCLANPHETMRHTERQRLKTQYVHEGRKVCLDAFLYLERCTPYQLKKIRKHLITDGVTPRIHGNCGKTPANTFTLDTYLVANEFLNTLMAEQKLKQNSKGSKNTLFHLPLDMTRIVVHDLYKAHCEKFTPNAKIIGYTTFCSFLRQQFPQLRFPKSDFSGQSVQPLQSATEAKAEVQGVEQTNELHQPVHQSVHQPVQQSVHQPVDQPVHQPVYQPMHQPVHQPVEVVNNSAPMIMTNNPNDNNQAYLYTPSNEPSKTYKVTQNKVLTDLGETMTVTTIDPSLAAHLKINFNYYQSNSMPTQNSEFY